MQNGRKREDTLKLSQYAQVLYGIANDGSLYGQVNDIASHAYVPN